MTAISTMTGAGRNQSKLECGDGNSANPTIHTTIPTITAM